MAEADGERWIEKSYPRCAVHRPRGSILCITSFRMPISSSDPVHRECLNLSYINPSQKSGVDKGNRGVFNIWVKAKYISRSSIEDSHGSCCFSDEIFRNHPESFIDMRAASQPLFRELRHATSMATPSTVSLSSRFFAPGLSSYISRLKVSASQRTFSTHTRKVRQQHVQQTHAAAPQSRTQLHVSEQATAIENLQKGLTDTLPCFAMRGEDVEVLGDPEVFHEHLLQMIKKARKRILISSLYIGTEQGELVSVFAGIACAKDVHCIVGFEELPLTFSSSFHR